MQRVKRASELPQGYHGLNLREKQRSRLIPSATSPVEVYRRETGGGFVDDECGNCDGDDGGRVGKQLS